MRRSHLIPGILLVLGGAAIIAWKHPWLLGGVLAIAIGSYYLRRRNPPAP